MLKNIYFKKYHDEVWGHIIRQKTYSYTKKLVLASYKLNFLKAKSYMQKKFAYHKPLFLKMLKKTLFNFKFFKKIYCFVNKQTKHRVFSLTKFLGFNLLRGKRKLYKVKRLAILRENFNFKFINLKKTTIAVLFFRMSLFNSIRSRFFF